MSLILDRMEPSLSYPKGTTAKTGDPSFLKEEKIKWAGSLENQILTSQVSLSTELPTGIAKEEPHSTVHLMSGP